jgi:thiamine pyrophosphokinase
VAFFIATRPDFMADSFESVRMFILVVANGKLAELEWLRPILKNAEVIIAADGGARHVMNLGREPDVVVGDMDSLSPADFDQLRANGVKMLAHSPEKDETDLELALRYAIEEFDGDIFIAGALGGRLDQTLGNILLLAQDHLSGRRVEIREAHQRAWLVKGTTQIHGAAGDVVSLIALGGDVNVAETAGLKWPLCDEQLGFGPSRGISNVMTGDVAEVRLNSGQLLCVHIDGKWLDTRSDSS